MSNTRLPNGRFDHIEVMFAWIASDDEGEGLLAIQGKDGAWKPLIGADRSRVDSWRAVALEIGMKSKREVRLVVYGPRKDLERWPAPKDEFSTEAEFKLENP